MRLRLEAVDERLDVKPKSLLLGEPGPGPGSFCESSCTRVRRIKGTGNRVAVCGANRTILTLQKIWWQARAAKPLLDWFITACLGVMSERTSHLTEREAASAKEMSSGATTGFVCFIARSCVASVEN